MDEGLYCNTVAGHSPGSLGRSGYLLCLLSGSGLLYLNTVTLKCGNCQSDFSFSPTARLWMASSFSNFDSDEYGGFLLYYNTVGSNCRSYPRQWL